MTQEEKAKAYDEAIERANNILEGKCKNVFIYDNYNRTMIDYLLSELKESEDERIRKALIDWFSDTHAADDFKGIAWERIVAWLEKRGENNMGISEATKQELEDNLNKALEKETPESWSEFLDEQKSAWSEEDEIALGDALWCCKQAASIAKDENDMGNAWYAENWLKSLKDRYTWKPSDEQLRELRCVISGCSFETPILVELEEQLEKL